MIGGLFSLQMKKTCEGRSKICYFFSGKQQPPFFVEVNFHIEYLKLNNLPGQVVCLSWRKSAGDTATNPKCWLKSWVCPSSVSTLAKAINETKRLQDTFSKSLKWPPTGEYSQKVSGMQMQELWYVPLVLTSHSLQILPTFSNHSSGALRIQSEQLLCG